MNYSNKNTALVGVYNMYKTFYGSRVHYEEPVLRFIIKPNTIKIMMPSIIGEYTAYGIDFLNIKHFLGTSDIYGSIDISKNVYRDINDDDVTLVNLGLIKPSEITKFINIEIVPKNNEWKNWVKTLSEKNIFLDNFKYENDGMIYVYALCIQKNVLISEKESVQFYNT